MILDHLGNSRKDVLVRQDHGSRSNQGVIADFDSTVPVNRGAHSKQYTSSEPNVPFISVEDAVLLDPTLVADDDFSWFSTASVEAAAVANLSFFSDMNA